MKKIISSFILGLLLAGPVSAGLIGETAKGTTDYSVELKIIDSADGTPETAVVFNTAGIDLWYRRQGAASVDITEATLAALTTAHTDGGFLAINDGIYRLDLPDAAVASGADYVYVGGTVTGMIVIGGRVQLTGVDMNDGVRAGLTSLPNAAADAAGGLAISDAGGLDLDGLNTNVNDIETDTADMQPKLGTFTDFGSGTSTLAANLQDLADNGTAVYDRSTDSLQAIRDRGDAAWVTGAGGTGLTALADGTAQSGTASTIVLAAAETFGDDILNGAVVNLTGGTGAGQTRVITDYTGATDTASVSPNWTTNPDATSTYEVVNGSTNTATLALTAQTANDNGADINAILVDTGTTLETHLTDIKGGTFSGATDSLEAIRDRGDAAWTTGSGTGLTAIASGTAQSATGTTLVLAAGETFADDELIGAVVQITGGTAGVGQSRCISDNVGSTDTITVDTWTTTPTGTITYEVAPSLGGTCPLAAASGAGALNVTPSGNIGIDWANVENATSTVGLSGTTVGTVTTNTDMRGTDSAATASALATAQADLDTLTGSDGATLATSQPNYAPATAAAVAALNDLDAAGVRTAVGLASANLDTQIAALPTAAEIWQVQCEDQGGGYSCQEAMSLLLAEAMGTCTYTTGSRTWVCSDPSGTETRFTLVYGSSLDGTRSTSTPAPMTP